MLYLLDNNASINNVGEDKVVELMSYSTIEELKHKTAKLVFYGGLFPFEQDNCLLVIKRIKEYHYHSNPKYTRPRRDFFFADIFTDDKDRLNVGVAAEGGGVGYDENDDSACSRIQHGKTMIFASFLAQYWGIWLTDPIYKKKNLLKYFRNCSPRLAFL
ncbi:hypothetical protein RIR_jg32177.t1 [Rhizophagus irregularis DAOM 181602=DAOM 197198]|nr:hypothetical protein RIR_jg32177.t1 [Rhizophagus irregularis DAOM 181602=DAOM 197198]